jgi:hypothetical protein
MHSKQGDHAMTEKPNPDPEPQQETPPTEPKDAGQA